MFKIGDMFLNVSKVAKIGLSNINRAVLWLKSYQANLYFNKLLQMFAGNKGVLNVTWTLRFSIPLQLTIRIV